MRRSCYIPGCSQGAAAVRENCSGFLMNPERFSTGLVLPFTHKRTNPK